MTFLWPAWQVFRAVLSEWQDIEFVSSKKGLLAGAWNWLNSPRVAFVGSVLVLVIFAVLQRIDGRLRVNREPDSPEPPEPLSSSPPAPSVIEDRRLRTLTPEQREIMKPILSAISEDEKQFSRTSVVYSTPPLFEGECYKYARQFHNLLREAGWNVAFEGTSDTPAYQRRGRDVGVLVLVAPDEPAPGTAVTLMKALKAAGITPVLDTGPVREDHVHLLVGRKW